MRKYYSIKSVKALQSCAFFVLSRKKERKKESESERWRVKEEGAETHTKKTLLLKFLFEEIQKKKDQKHKRATCSLARDRKNDQKNNPSARTRARKRERGGTLVITLHTHNTRFHHGTQTNLETVHLQNDRVRAFIKPSERCANVQHRHRGVEIRELARVVR
jgi:hypothetical protein